MGVLGTWASWSTFPYDSFDGAPFIDNITNGQVTLANILHWTTLN